MSTLHLDPQTDRRLADLAVLTGEAPDEIVRRAVAAYATEIEAARECVANEWRKVCVLAGLSMPAFATARLIARCRACSCA